MGCVGKGGCDVWGEGREGVSCVESRELILLLPSTCLPSVYTQGERRVGLATFHVPYRANQIPGSPDHVTRNVVEFEGFSSPCACTYFESDHVLGIVTQASLLG